MTTTLRYFISGNQADVLRLGTPGSEYALTGQQVIATGSATVNHLHAALGVDLDARNLLAGEDVVVFNYRWDQYSKSLAQSGSIVFTYNDVATGLSEKVTVLNGSSTFGRDKLVFADGAALAQNARNALTSDINASIGSILSFDTTTKTGSYVVPKPAGNTLRAFGSTTSTTAGATFAMAEAGQTLVTTGSTQVDKLYVKAGATVDARFLLGGEDVIYLTGNWADYSKNLAAVSGAIQFTRTVTVEGQNHTESVTVLNGAAVAGRDKLVFADGAVLTHNVRAALQTNLTAPITAVTGYDANTVTPFLAPPTPEVTGVTSSVADDGTYSLSDFNAQDDTFQVTFTVTFNHAPGTLSVSDFALSSGTDTLNIASVTVDPNNAKVYTVVADMSMGQDGDYTLSFKGATLSSFSGAAITLNLTEPGITDESLTVGAGAYADAVVNLAEWNDAGSHAITWAGALSEDVSSLRVSYEGIELLNDSSLTAGGSFSKSLSLGNLKNGLSGNLSTDPNTGLALLELDVQATDANGNTSHSTLTLQFDTLALAPTLTSVLPGTVRLGGVQALELEGHVFEAGTLKLQVLDGSTVLRTQSADLSNAGNWHFSLSDASGLQSGQSYTLQLAFTDTAGNSAEANFTRMFEAVL